MKKRWGLLIFVATSFVFSFFALRPGAPRCFLSPRSVLLRTEPELGWRFDTRPVKAGLLHAGYVSHDMAVKQVVNPFNRELVAVYGGAGTDLSNFLLSTNALTSYFVDDRCYAHLNADDFRQHLRHCRFFPEYLDKFINGFAIVDSMGTHLVDPVLRKECILGAIGFELESLGVDLKRVEVDEEQGNPRICFPWRYAGGAEKKYLITFVNVMLSHDEEEMGSLGELLVRHGGIDLYYQRAMLQVPMQYGTGNDFLPALDRWMRPGGFFVTDDYASFFNFDVDFSGRSFPFPYPEISVGQFDDWKKQMPVRDHQLKTGYGWHVRVRQKPFASDPIASSI